MTAVIVDHEGLRERLADLCHQQWTGWMDYLFSCCEQNEGGTLTIPAKFVGRWHRQMHTSYKDLPENEAKSDRKEADRFLRLLTPDLSAAQADLAEQRENAMRREKQEGEKGIWRQQAK